jgi:chromosome segregation ATPase
MATQKKPSLTEQNEELRERCSNLQSHAHILAKDLSVVKAELEHARKRSHELEDEIRFNRQHIRQLVEKFR